VIEWQRAHRRPTRQKPTRLTGLAKIAEVIWWLSRRLWQYGPQRLPFAVLTALIVFALANLLLGSKLRVEHVEVSGTHLTDPASVIQVADVEGRNPFTINTAMVAKQIKKLGVYESVQVAVRLPNLTTIHVTEQQPAYIWKVDPTLYLVAHDGTILGPTPDENERVIVVDADHQAVRIGQKIDPRILEEAAYLLAVLPLTTSLSPHYLLYSRASGLMIPTNDGFTVTIGDDTNIKEKIEMLGPTLRAAEAASPRPSVVDVRFIRRPYFH